MKYSGMPVGMWILFVGSFKRNLTDILGFTKQEASDVTAKAKIKYKAVIGNLPEFEKKDRFKMNIVSCAMLAAFILNMPEKPDVDKMADYYRESMLIPAARWFFRMLGKQKFTDKDVNSLKKTAMLNAADRNLYSWNMEFLPYADGSGYEARFYKCGICTLMSELGLEDYIPAMCRLDYAMTEAGGASEFVRKYTLASGGPYCDCGYKKKRK